MDVEGAGAGHGRRSRGNRLVSVAAFLEELRSHDVQVWPEGDQLRCNAPAGVLTPALRDQLRERKRDIVQFLRSAETAARQQRAIIPLQPRGDRIPVFAVGGHNGDVFCYRALAQHLGPNQPFFGLQPPGLDGESEPLTTVEELAKYFAAQIRASRPSGASIIAGYCAGGAIAFELAWQLLQQGASIGFVALFAGRYPTWFRPLAQMRQRVVGCADRVETHAHALAPLSNGERRRYLTDMFGRLIARPDVRRPTEADPALALRAKVQRATMEGIRRYRPPYLPGRLSLFLPSSKARRPTEGLVRWRTLAREVEEYCGPDGCEGDVMLLEPHVPAIAALFQRCRDGNQEGADALRAG
jgi:thioesterase domain-containing protein